MSLISRSDLIKVSGLSRIGFLKNPVASAIMSLTKIDEVNKLYDVLKDKKGKDFFDSFVRERQLKIHCLRRRSCKNSENRSFYPGVESPSGRDRRDSDDQNSYRNPAGL